MSALPPGPKGPAFVNLARWIWDPIALFEECERDYGEYFTVRIPGMAPNVVFSDPAAVKALFTVDPDDVRVRELAGLLEPVMGPSSVMLVDGPRHLRKRKLMLPPFHGERMRAYGEAMQRSIRRAMDGWKRGESFEMVDAMLGVTLDVIQESVIGPSENDARMREVVHEFLELGTSPLATALLLATPQALADRVIYRSVDPIRLGPVELDVGRLVPWRETVLAQRRMDSTLYREIELRRASSLEGREDVLSLLMSARDENGEPMTDAELRDEMVTLLLAGHETTAITLAWAVYYLVSHPRVLSKLRAELRAPGAMAVEKLTSHEYLDAILRETMRLSPVALFVGRHLMQPMKLGKWELPAGVNALACNYLAQRRADLWDRPLEFDPDRWAGAKNDPYKFFPFGGGTRRCIGMAFAFYEMKIILGEIAASVDLRLADARPIKPVRKSTTFAPSRGLPVVLDDEPVVHAR